MRDVAGKFWDVPDHGHFRTSLVFGTVPGFCVPILGRCLFFVPSFGVWVILGLGVIGVPILGLGFVSVWVIGVWGWGL